MEVREKLVELIRCADYHPCRGAARTIGSMFTTEFIEDIASHLIANGVTVQEWISVKDRVPEKPMKCLVYTKRGEYGGYEITHYNEGFYLQYENVTHSMTLPEEPQPPKGE